ncbi:MAG: hypothetical protein L3J47_00590 [Sulfurovum sp.]|nr:hypothetical protein [Sulfurovum sp.]
MIYKIGDERARKVPKKVGDLLNLKDGSIWEVEEQVDVWRGWRAPENHLCGLYSTSLSRIQMRFGPKRRCRSQKRDADLATELQDRECLALLLKKQKRWYYVIYKFFFSRGSKSLSARVLKEGEL